MVQLPPLDTTSLSLQLPTQLALQVTPEQFAVLAAANHELLLLQQDNDEHFLCRRLLYQGFQLSINN